jgi:hypothetical protein
LKLPESHRHDNCADLQIALYAGRRIRNPLEEKRLLTGSFFEQRQITAGIHEALMGRVAAKWNKDHWGLRVKSGRPEGKWKGIRA